MPETVSSPILNSFTEPAETIHIQESETKAPAYRKVENLHIVFWLIKDISWCMFWKPLGLAMIIPTLIIALILAWRSRTNKSEFAHNLAIIFWIAANSYWMISEFAGFDETKIWRSMEGKHFAIIPFVLGMLVLANYYALQPILRKLKA